MKDMRPLVTMLSYGKWLETYLDHKCKRHQAKAHASWMSSPDFSYNLDRRDTSSESRSDVVSETVTLVDPAGQEARAAQGRREPPGREPPDLPLIKRKDDDFTSTTSSAEKHFGIVPEALYFQNWPSEAIQLDQQLHATLLMLVSGPKRDYIQDVPYPSYCMAMANLWSNDQVTRSDRQLRALAAVQNLEFKGNIATFSNVAHQAISELYSSGVTIESVVLLSLRNAFKSRGPHICMEIGKDIDDNPDLKPSRVYDLLQKYCNLVAASGYGGVGNTKDVNNVDQKVDQKGSKGGKGGKVEKGGKGKGGRKKGGKGGKGEKRREEDNKDKKKDDSPPKKESEVFSLEDMKKWMQAVEDGSSAKSKKKKKIEFSNLVTTEVNANLDDPTKPQVWVSLFDGKGCGAKVIPPFNPKCDRYIGVETSAVRRRIADHANPQTNTFPGISRELGHDVMDITREDIEKLSSSSTILGMIGGWPCRNLSWLRTRKGKDGRIPHKSERSGIFGKESGKYFQMLKVWQWIKEFNPNADYFLENVVFDKLKEQWEKVCEDFGKPIMVNAKDHSYSHRRRAYWTSWALPPDLFEDLPPLDPNDCLDKGRTFDLKRGMRTVTASWRGDPENPEQFTSVPIIIKDENQPGDQRIRSHEAEKLHHLPSGYTAAPGVTEADRLSAIGDGWDLLITKRIWEYCPVRGQIHIQNPTLPENFLIPEESLTSADKALIAIMEKCDVDRCLGIITMMDTKEKQIRAFRCYLQSRQNKKDHTKPIHNVEKLHYAVIDSGASRHASKRVIVRDPNDVIELRGFTGESTISGGTGDLPFTIKTIKGDKTNINFDDADQVDMVRHDLLSLGKMLHKGWSFHLNAADELLTWTPQGEKIKLILTENDLLALPIQKEEVNQVSRLMDQASADFLHETLNHANSEKIFRTLENTYGYTAKRLPKVKCRACAMAKATKRPLRHDKWDHDCSIMEILGADSDDDDESSPSTSSGESDDEEDGVNYDPDPVPELISGREDESISDSEDEEDDEESSEEEDSRESQPTVRRVPVKRTPRHELSKLRPWEVIYVDNKSYNLIGHEVRGLKQETLIIVDVKSHAIRIIDVDRKAHNGKAFEAFIAREGISKLPYQCTVYADGCGSMKNIEKKCNDPSLNVRFEPTPPNDQSLNEAEKICNHTWNEAMAVVEHAQTRDGTPPWKWFPYALQYVAYVHERMATTKSRGWKTPFEICTGIKPDISHLRPFWTTAYVTTPREKRKQLAAQGEPPLRAQEGNFVGFHGTRGATYAVVLEGDRLVKNRSVQFNSKTHFAKNGASEDSSTSEERQVLIPDHQLEAQPEGVRRHRNVARAPESFGQGGVNEGDSEDESQSDTSTEYLEDVHIEPMPSFSDDDESEHSSPSTTPLHRHEEMERRGRYLAEPPLDLPRLRSSARMQNCEEALHEFKTVCGPLADELDISTRDAFINVIEHLQRLDESVEKELATQERLVTECCHILNSYALREDQIDMVAHSTACDMFAVQGQHDIGWARALAGPDRQKVIDAYEKEMASLCDTILQRVLEGDEDYRTAIQEAVTGRLILDVKRKLGTYKARGVKQGFKENILWADGPGFNYYSSVAKLHSARLTLFRPHRRNRRICVVDVATAYLQAHEFDGFIKYIVFKNPITGELEYYRQYGPIYGEKSSAVRWENTIAPWMEESDQGFIRGDNERCIFWHPERDLVVCLYVDDCLIDGDEDDIKWFLQKINARFKCKEAEWLSPSIPLDYLGMEVTMDGERVYICMEQYIYNMVKMLELEGKRRYTTPIGAPIDTTSRPLSPKERKRFMQALGCVGWLVNTARPDVAYAHSRIAQHMASPNLSAWEAIKRVCLYLRDTANLALSAPSWEIDITHCRDKEGNKPELDNCDSWAWFTDSDFAGNQEPQNNRRSQNGYLAILNGAPVLWGSKVSSVAFAHPKIGEAHADISSAAAEIYGAANATYDFLALSYVAEEAGLEVKLPIIMQGDNTACEAFINHSSARTKLKHIDCRQKWVKLLRNKEVLLPVHVDSADNLADLFTKILDRQVFEKLRDAIMVRRIIKQEQ